MYVCMYVYMVVCVHMYACLRTKSFAVDVLHLNTPGRKRDELGRRKKEWHASIRRLHAAATLQDLTSGRKTEPW